MSTSLPSLPPLSPLAGAIAKAEGYGVPGAIPTITNNPGDLEVGDQGNGTKTTADGGQVTIFGSLESGAQALENQVASIFNGTSSNYTPDMTLDQFGQIYGSSASYGSLLGKILGVPSSTTLADVQGMATTGTKSVNGSLLSRAIVLILGIILFGAGVLSFKTSQTIIQTGTKVVSKVGEHAGEIAAL